MPYQSRWKIPIPVTSLPSFIFTSPTATLSDEPIFVDTKRPETHHFSLCTFREWSQRFAAGLVAAGLQPGDRVTLFSGNSIFMPIVVMGIIMASGVYTSSNPAFNERELAYQLKDSGASFMLTAEANVLCALAGAKMAGLRQDRVYIFGDVALDESAEQTLARVGQEGPVRHWRHLLASPETGMKFRWAEYTTRQHADQTAILIYSSGTMGMPKGVQASHYKLVANASQLIHLQNLDPHSATNRSPRGLGFLPLYHGLGLVYYVLVAPKRGLRVYLMDRFDLLHTVENIQRFKITELLMVPPVVVGMAKHPLIRKGRYDLSSVRKVVCGAAPLGNEATALFEQLWPDGSVKVRQAWGMSEAPCIVLCWDDRQTSEPSTTSVGELLANCEAKIMDEEGFQEVPRGQKGEFWCRGPNMQGYWRNLKATRETLTSDGWLKTGDIAYVDAKGKFFIVDRKKELIKVRGSQVAPAELEALLLEHPLIVDTAVIGAKINEDECPRAYIVPRTKNALTEIDVVKFVDARVAKIKRITGGVVFVNSIPKTPSGKILRRQLRDRAAAELKADDVVLVAARL